MAADYQVHYPVMLPEVLDALAVADGKVYVDATFGNGGYSEAILNKANCKVIALDRDNTVLPRVEELKKQFGDRFDFRQGCFGDFAELVEENIDGAVFDIGVSSMQLDQAERGFSFAKDAPLDMRMSQTGTTAADLVNNLSETALADILYNYGEEKKSRQIAKKIVETRKIKPITTTCELANIIYQVIKRSFNQAIDPATRSFQALRIAGSQGLFFVVFSAVPDGSNRMDHIPGGQAVSLGQHSLTRRTAANGAAFFFQLRTRCPVDGAVYATSAHEGRVGGIHDGIYVHEGNIVSYDLKGHG